MITNPYSERQKEIFSLALALSPEARSRFVKQQCGEDQSLFDAVTEMLRNHDEVTEVFEKSSELVEERPLGQRDEFRGNSRFKLIRRLGSGGFGVVYEALDRKSGMTIALKVLTRPAASELRMFKREFRALAEVSHPNVVQLYELVDDGGHWFFTMELVRGADLISYVNGSPERARRALTQLARAVRYLHQRKMLHRDIKPRNIRMTAEGDLKLLDFGLVRDVSHDSGTSTQIMAGTAAYMAPELLTNPTLRETSDWYSVGAVLYEALTGKPPFEGESLEVLMRKSREAVRPPRELVPDLPEDLNDLCMNLLDRNPTLRLSGDAIIEQLAAQPEDVPFSPPEEASPMPLVGRETHLSALHEAFEETLRGHTVCVHVQGGSGMGKSALCKQFLSEVRKAGAMIFSGRCYESESVPFKALDPVVDSLGDYLKNLGGFEAAAFLPREGPLQALSRLFPTLLAVEAIGRNRSGSGIETSPRDLQRRAVAALKETLARISEKIPCVVFIDDLQWGDLDSIECLTGILGPPDPPLALFLFSYRSEDISSTRHLQRLLEQQRDHELYRGKLREVIVNRLSSPECRQLVQRLLGPESDSVYRRIDGEADGMPLFIHELALQARCGIRSAAAGPEGVSLQEMIRRRIALLPVPARRMMEVVSLAAKPLDIDIARHVARLEDGEPPARNALVAQRLIRFKSSDAGGKVEPYHDKIREAVVAGIASDAKRAYFLALAIVLEAREGADAEVVYQYFLAAGEEAKAEKWIEIAAERAESALAFDLAVKLREKRIQIRDVPQPERSVLLERLAQALALAGQGLKSAQVYESAAQGAAPNRQCQLIRKAGEQYIRSGHFEEGCALLGPLLQRVGFPMPVRRWQVVLMLLLRRSFLRLRGLRFNPHPAAPVSLEESERLEICRVTSLALALQDPVRSAELQARHLLHSLRLGEPYRIANSLAMEAGYLVARSGSRAYESARRLLDKVEELAVHSHHPNGQSLAVSVRSKVAWLAGHWKESAAYGEEVNRMATEQYTRVAWEAYPSSIFWMCSLFCMGRWRELIERLPGLQADSRARGDLLEMTSLPIFTFAYVRWLLADEPEVALTELERARIRLNEPGFILHRFGVCYGLADVALYMQDTDQAQRSVTEGWSQLKDAMLLRLQPVRIFMMHARARVSCAAAAAATDPLTRRRLLAGARADAQRIRSERTGWGNALSSLIEAAIAAEEGRADDAIRFVELAEQGLLLAGMDHFVTVARYRKAHLLQSEARIAAQRQAAGWFAAQKVSNPGRIAHLLSPGSWHDREIAEGVSRAGQ
jgi:serine/threonine protein kinase